MRNLIIAATFAVLGLLGALHAAQPATVAATCCDGGSCCDDGSCCK